MAWTGFGGGKGSINSGNQNMASGNPSAANYGGGGNNNSGGNQGNGGGNNTTSSRDSSTASRSPSATTAAAASAAKTGIGDTGKQNSGSIMGGLIGAVDSARSSRATSSPQSAVNSAFSSSESLAPAAATAGRRMSEAAAQGYDAATNAGMTESAFGAGGTVGSLAGKAIGAVTSANPYGDNTPESVAYNTGRATAKDAGLGSGTKGLASLAAGVLGGPIGSALASLALGGISYGMQRDARESALPGIADTTRPSTGNPTVNGVVGDRSSQLGTGGGSSKMANAMSQAGGSVPVENPFEFASDYEKERNSYQNLDLTRGI